MPNTQCKSTLFLAVPTHYKGPSLISQLTHCLWGITCCWKWCQCSELENILEPGKKSSGGRSPRLKYSPTSMHHPLHPHWAVTPTCDCKPPRVQKCFSKTEQLVLFCYFLHVFFLKKGRVGEAQKVFHGLPGHPYWRGGDASSCLLANIYRAVQPEAVLSQNSASWSYSKQSHFYLNIKSENCLENWSQTEN